MTQSLQVFLLEQKMETKDPIIETKRLKCFQV